MVRGKSSGRNRARGWTSVGQLIIDLTQSSRLFLQKGIPFIPIAFKNFFSCLAELIRLYC